MTALITTCCITCQLISPCLKLFNSKLAEPVSVMFKAVSQAWQDLVQKMQKSFTEQADCCILHPSELPLLKKLPENARLISHLPKCLAQERYLVEFLNEFKTLLTGQTLNFRRNRRAFWKMLYKPYCPKKSKKMKNLECS